LHAISSTYIIVIFMCPGWSGW